MNVDDFMNRTTRDIRVQRPVQRAHDSLRTRQLSRNPTRFLNGPRDNVAFRVHFAALWSRANPSAADRGKEPVSVRARAHDSSPRRARWTRPKP